MIGFGSEVQKNIFDQNRAYAAFGFRLGGSNNLELGYMQQTVQQGSGQVIEYNHTLQIAWFSSVSLGR